MSEYLSVAIEAAKIAGEYQRNQFEEITEHDYKSPGNPVSGVDHRSEALIVERLVVLSGPYDPLRRIRDDGRSRDEVDS